jgi:Eukaryotic initiation factor 4E
MADVAGGLRGDADEHHHHEDEDAEHILHDTWTLYFHEPSETDWTMSSYVRLEEISSIESFWQVHEGVRRYLSKGMFFLMREHVFPCWDDPGNIQGGCISIKVLKEDIEAFWEEAVVRMLGERFVKDDGGDTALMTADKAVWSLVNGISTSPKRYFCICKVWLKEGLLTEKQFFRLPATYHGEPLYRSNAENIRQNNEK